MPTLIVLTVVLAIVVTAVFERTAHQVRVLTKKYIVLLGKVIRIKWASNTY